MARTTSADGSGVTLRALSQAVAAADDTPISSLVRMAILTGMRRGELLSLRWRDVDLLAGVAHVQQTAQRITGRGWVYRQPKTRLSRRAVALSPATVGMLSGHRKAQLEARLLAGSAWHDLDLVFASALGTPLEPGTVARTWRRVLAAAGVGHVRWHDLRHAHATLMLASGVHPKVLASGWAMRQSASRSTPTACPARPPGDGRGAARRAAQSGRGRGNLARSC